MKTTKVVCPKCGTEMAIQEHESLTIGIAIGKDSGLGTVELQAASEENTNSINNKAEMKASKKIQAMKAAGINVSNLFSVANAEGVERIARIENGEMEFLSDDDPIMSAIFEKGPVPNRRLFRRWVMGQVFHMLTQKHWKTGQTIGFLAALQRKGYRYSWEMLIEELRVQVKLEMFDNENFVQRNRWFNKQVTVEMANEYFTQLSKHIEKCKSHCKKCKGNPYITLNGQHIFVDDLVKKVFNPLGRRIASIKSAKSTLELHNEVLMFYGLVKEFYSPYDLTISQAFKDAYKGAGGYYTMRNLIMFHGCKMRSEKGNRLAMSSSLRELDKLAEAYKNGEGWRMFGAMKELIADNGIDIEAKMNEWRSK